MLRPLPGIAVTLFAGHLAACSSPGPLPTDQTPPLAAGQVLTTNAIVRFVDLEGGCWAIETAPGRGYEPVNLDVAFRIDGLHVRVVLRDAPGVAGSCQMAPFVTIDSISTP